MDGYSVHAVYLTGIELFSAVPSFYMLFKHHVTFRREYEYTSVRSSENVQRTNDPVTY